MRHDLDWASLPTRDAEAAAGALLADLLAECPDLDLVGLDTGSAVRLGYLVDLAAHLSPNHDRAVRLSLLAERLRVHVATAPPLRPMALFGRHLGPTFDPLATRWGLLSGLDLGRLRAEGLLVDAEHAPA